MFTNILNNHILQKFNKYSIQQSATLQVHTKMVTHPSINLTPYRVTLLI